MTPAEWATIRHFTPREFACRDARGGPCPHCGGQERMDVLFVVKLDAARARYGRPVIVTSGSRCEQRNAEVGGSATSSHLFTDKHDACAADLSDQQSPTVRGALVEALWHVGFRQLEVSRDGHLHVMDDRRKPTPFLGIEP